MSFFITLDSLRIELQVDTPRSMLSGTVPELGSFMSLHRQRTDDEPSILYTRYTES